MQGNQTASQAHPKSHSLTTTRDVRCPPALFSVMRDSSTFSALRSRLHNANMSAETVKRPCDLAADDAYSIASVTPDVQTRQTAPYDRPVGKPSMHSSRLPDRVVNTCRCEESQWWVTSLTLYCIAEAGFKSYRSNPQESSSLPAHVQNLSAQHECSRQSRVSLADATSMAEVHRKHELLEEGSRMLLWQGSCCNP